MNGQDMKIVLRFDEGGYKKRNTKRLKRLFVFHWSFVSYNLID